MSANQEWVRKTQFSVNTSARVPNALYKRLERYTKGHGLSKTDVINKALDAYLPEYVDLQEEGGRRE